MDHRKKQLCFLISEHAIFRKLLGWLEYHWTRQRYKYVLKDRDLCEAAVENYAYLKLEKRYGAIKMSKIGRAHV